MSSATFHFKQFSVSHDRCAMKVGTDGVLLGAWTNVSKATRILDVGSGSGLLALMLAQRSEAIIDAIEIDPAAALQAQENVADSPWPDRIKVINLPVQEYQADQGYDLIISNPPFYQEDIVSPNAERKQARHTTALNFDELIEHATRLASPSARFNVILPYSVLASLTNKAERLGWHLSHKTIVFPKPNVEPKRVLLELARKQVDNSTVDELIIEIGRHQYSEAYQALAAPYLLAL